MDPLFTLNRLLRYRLAAKTPHKVHSPFIFRFMNDVLLDTTPFYVFEPIESLRSLALLDNRLIEVEDFGAGSKLNRKRQRSVRSIARQATLPARYAQLLFRIINHTKAERLLEMGTSLGLTSLYLAMPSRQSKLITLEGSPAIAEAARNNFQRLGAHNIDCRVGEFGNTLPKALHDLERIDFAFIDGNHRYLSTVEYFHLIRSYGNEDSVLVFDDIYWSRDMHRAWKEIISHESVAFSIDLFRLGIVFFKKSAPPQHFTLRF